MVCYLRAAYYFFANMTVRNRWYERNGSAAQARRCEPRQRDTCAGVRATHTITRVQRRETGSASTARNPQHEKNGCRAAVFN